MSTQVHVPVEHVIGAGGLVVLRIPSGEISVRGVDGDTVRLSSPAGRHIAEDYRITPSDGRLDVSMHDSWGLGLGWLGGRRSGPIAVEMPRGASLWIDTASGTVNIVGIGGEQRYRAASGSLDLADVSGQITVDQVSGDVRIDASGPIRLDARTVSGELKAVAPAFERVVARLMSGDVRLTGRLAGEGPFTVESVSGDVTLDLDGPVRIDGSTISGRIRTNLPHRDGGRAGHRTVEIGEGGVQVLFKTVSGDLTVRGPQAGRAAPEAPIATTEPTEPVATAVPAAPPAEPPADARLAVLRDLEDGRIDVAAASKKLAELDAAEESAGSRSRTFAIGPISGELRWDHRA